MPSSEIAAFTSPCFVSTKSRTPAMPNSAVSSAACIAASFPQRSSLPIAARQRHHEIRHAGVGIRRGGRRCRRRTRLRGDAAVSKLCAPKDQDHAPGPMSRHPFIRERLRWPVARGRGLARAVAGGCEGSGWRQKTSGDLSQGVGHGRVLRVPRSRVLSQRDRQFFVVRVHCESRSNASKIRSSVIRAHRSHAPKAIPEVGLSRSIATTKPPGRSSLRERFSTVAPFLDERGRRLVAAAEAFAAGYGGIAAVAIATGVAPSTIGRGLKELAQDEPSERIRRPGAGRKRTISKDPTLLPDLEALVEPTTRGDPESPLRWTCKSVRRLAQALQAQGHAVSRTLVCHLLNEAGYSLQGNRKTTEGDSHPDRDAQFGYINTQVSTALAEQQPVISVDTKKKELVGDFRNNG